MKHSLSWEADKSLREYHVHKSPLLIPSLRQMNPGNILPPHVFKIY
jgi:hypothetical protein